MTSELARMVRRSLVIVLMAMWAVAQAASPIDAMAGAASSEPTSAVSEPTSAVRNDGPLPDVVPAPGSWALPVANSPQQSPAQPWTAVVRAAYQPQVLGIGGSELSCAIRLDRSLGCWGLREHVTPPPDGAFSAIGQSTGLDVCGIRSDGTLACWGEGTLGARTPPAGTFSQVATGEEHSCGLRDDGTIACWGDDSSGQATAPAGTFTAIAVGEYHSCAIREDGTLLCWGLSSEDQIEAPAGTFEAIGAGESHTCAVRADDHSVACWGDNQWGQAEPPAGSFVTVDGSWAHTCGIRTDGAIACWGPTDDEADYGQGHPPAGTFKALAAAGTNTCAIRTTGQLICWGEDHGPRPTAAIGRLPGWRTSTRIPVRWTSIGAIAPVTSSDVRYRRAAWDGRFGPWVRWRTATKATGATLIGSPGSSYCFSVRARDADARLSLWSRDRCVAIPVDDRAASRSAAWTPVSGTQFYRSTALRSTTHGASLQLARVVAQRIALVATTCPRCGSVQVYWNSRLVATVGLYSRTRVDQADIPVVEFRVPRTGELKLVVASTSGNVIVDGIIASRHSTLFSALGPK